MPALPISLGSTFDSAVRELLAVEMSQMGKPSPLYLYVALRNKNNNEPPKADETVLQRIARHKAVASQNMMPATVSFKDIANGTYAEISVLHLWGTVAHDLGNLAVPACLNVRQLIYAEWAVLSKLFISSNILRKHRMSDIRAMTFEEVVGVLTLPCFWIEIVTGSSMKGYGFPGRMYLTCCAGYVPGPNS